MILPQKPLIRFGWLRALLGFVTFLVIYFGISSTVNLIDKSGHAGGDSSPGGLLTSVLIVNFGFFITCWLLRKFVDRRSFVSLGFKWNGCYTVIGVVVGFAVIGVGTLFLWVINYLQFIEASFLPGAFLLNVLVFALVAFGEELFFRGYMLNNLLQSMNKWLALGISALVFMTMHLENPGAAGSLMPIISLIMGGLLLGVNYMYTQNLWYGFALHFVWNFLQGPVLGYDVSGTELKPIFTHILSGPALITGGAFGYEGSLCCIALCVIALVILTTVFKKES